MSGACVSCGANGGGTGSGTVVVEVCGSLTATAGPGTVKVSVTLRPWSARTMFASATAESTHWSGLGGFSMSMETWIENGSASSGAHAISVTARGVGGVAGGGGGPGGLSGTKALPIGSEATVTLVRRTATRREGSASSWLPVTRPRVSWKTSTMPGAKSA